MEKIAFVAGSEKKFFDFISKLNDKDNIALLAHLDNDGITSAVIASKVIGKIEHLQFFVHTPKMLVPVLSELKKKKINKIIMLDLSVDSMAEEVREMEKFAEILLIDHHLFSSDLNSGRISMLMADSDFPASYMCYYLFSKIQKIEGWIAALGIASDRVGKYHDKNAHEVFNDFGLGEAPKNGYFWKYVIALNYAWIYLASTGRDGKELYELLMRAETITELDKLEAYAAEVRKELDRNLLEFDSKKENFGDMTLYYYEPAYSINSMLVNAISTRNRELTYIFMAKDKDFLRISARRADGKVDCVRLLKESVAGIHNSSTGGHPVAAGAIIPFECLGKFRENLLKTYDKLRT